MANPTQLYRHFDDAGVLLYVGISINAVNRLGQHKDHAHWYAAIRRVDVQVYPSREEALQAERKAILDEKPAHNLQRPSQREQAKLEETNAAEDSRRLLVRRIVEFNPIYHPDDVASMLGIGETEMNRLINEGRIGHVVLGRRTQNTAHGIRTITKRGITGWQLIEHIEAMEFEALNTEAAQ